MRPSQEPTLLFVLSDCLCIQRKAVGNEREKEGDTEREREGERDRETGRLKDRQ